MPGIKWKEYQERLMTEKEIDQHFFNCGGVIAITGNISNLICIDFDLDKQREEDDYWKMFMSQVPKDMKERMYINQTRSGGFHIWLRTRYEDKSRKITHRPLTMDELFDRHNSLVNSGANEQTAIELILKKPVECVIETRSKGSYGVFLHEQYKHFYGDKLCWFTEDEVGFLLNIGYSLDYNFRRPKQYTGDEADYSLIKRFDEDCSAEDVVKMITDTGLFTFHDIDSNGSHRLARVGSDHPFSAYVYKDTGILHVFGLNPLVDHDKQSMTPFEVLCATQNCEEADALQALKKRYAV
jgi:hypothetical protein